MSFYFSCFFVIMCLGALVSTSKIYLCLDKNREVKIREETTRKLKENEGFPIINGLVQVGSQAWSWTQWMRKLLKALRKWCNSHPPEVKLGKCFASYFNIKIPGLRRYKKINHSIEGTTETEYPREMSKKFKIKTGAFGECPTAKNFNVTPVKIFIFLLRDFLSEIRSRLKRFYNFIFKNELVVCVWDYFWKKFWTWVDSAPDSHSNV